MTAAGVQVEAHAKINLYLHVVGRRPDGFHLLDSLIAFAEAGDTLIVEPADALSLTVEGPTASSLPVGEDNIVLTAARRLAEKAGVAANARIRLIKRLPVAAGIGGGSADAAAALTALSRLWKTTLPTVAMSALALSLGADVPVCLRGKAAALSGIGEVLADTPPLPPAWLVLVNPMRLCPTPPVFKARSGPFSPPNPLTRACADAAGLAAALAERRNDLGPPAVSLVPEIGAVLERIGGQPGCLLARMSGSGATCFGLFADEAAAGTAAAAIHAHDPSWWVQAARLLG